MSSAVRPCFVTQLASTSSARGARIASGKCSQPSGCRARLKHIHSIDEWNYHYGDKPVPVELARADDEDIATEAENQGRLAPNWRDTGVVSPLEVLQPQEPDAASTWHTHVKYKLCPYWFRLQGRPACSYGKARCKFAHGLDDLSDLSSAFQCICSRVLRARKQCVGRMCQLRFIHTVEEWNYRHFGEEVPWELQQADPEGFRSLSEAACVDADGDTSSSFALDLPPPPPAVARQLSRASARDVGEVQEAQRRARQVLALELRRIVDAHRGLVELERLMAVYTTSHDEEWGDALVVCGIDRNAAIAQVVEQLSSCQAAYGIGVWLSRANVRFAVPVDRKSASVQPLSGTLASGGLLRGDTPAWGDAGLRAPVRQSSEAKQPHFGAGGATWPQQPWKPKPGVPVNEGSTTKPARPVIAPKKRRSQRRRQRRSRPSQKARREREPCAKTPRLSVAMPTRGAEAPGDHVGVNSVAATQRESHRPGPKSLAQEQLPPRPKTPVQQRTGTRAPRSSREDFPALSELYSERDTKLSSNAATATQGRHQGRTTRHKFKSLSQRRKAEQARANATPSNQWVEARKTAQSAARARQVRPQRHAHRPKPHVSAEEARKFGYEGTTGRGHSANMYMCPFYAAGDASKCPRGDRCTFAHKVEQLDNSSLTFTRVCPKLLKGQPCTDSACRQRFAHNRSEWSKRNPGMSVPQVLKTRRRRKQRRGPDPGPSRTNTDRGAGSGGGASGPARRR